MSAKSKRQTKYAAFQSVQSLLSLDDSFVQLGDLCGYHASQFTIVPDLG